MAAPIRYTSPVEDSGRWLDFEFRPGDIVISTRSKSGTTWTQMICALLIFQTEDLPAPLPELSPWLDWTGSPSAALHERLAAQDHRRFIKTHTPLDGVPIDPRVTYIVVGRHPLDTAVSLYHHAHNLDRARIRVLTGQPERSAPLPPLHDWLLSWIDFDGNARDNLDSLPGVAGHATDAWARRTRPNVALVHYDDLSADLEGEMRRLAARLGITVAEPTWPQLVAAARFDRMRSRAELLAPDPGRIIKQRDRFFLRGTSGAGRESLSAPEFARYRDRIGQLATPEVIAWLHGRST